MTDQKIIMPIGELAGKSIDLSKALTNLSVEISHHKDELSERIRLNPLRQKEILKSEQDFLTNLNTAILYIWFQVTDPVEREKQMVGDFSKLAITAKKLNIVIPPEFE